MKPKVGDTVFITTDSGERLSTTLTWVNENRVGGYFAGDPISGDINKVEPYGFTDKKERNED